MHCQWYSTKRRENSSPARHAEAALLIFCRRVRFSTLTGPDSRFQTARNHKLFRWFAIQDDIDCHDINFNYDAASFNQRIILAVSIEKIPRRATNWHEWIYRLKTRASFLFGLGNRKFFSNWTKSRVIFVY